MKRFWLAMMAICIMSAMLVVTVSMTMSVTLAEDNFTTAPMIAAGGSHTVALHSDGGVGLG